MCEMCTGEFTTEKVVADLRERIADRGYATVGIAGVDVLSAYTIGMHLRGLRDLYIRDMPHPMKQVAFDSLAAHHADSPLDAEQIIRFGDTPDCYGLTVMETYVTLPFVRKIYGQEANVTAYQVTRLHNPGDVGDQRTPLVIKFG